jgi:predicted MPP superfamily phosphohydrolase
MKWLARALAAFAALALLFLGVGYWNATRPPVVVNVRLPLAGLPAGREIRVLHISDTHYGHPDMRTRRLLEVTRQANALKPDLIVLTGDYMGGKLLDKPRSWLEEALPPLAALNAPLGVYAVLGNHDEPTWTRRVMARQVRPKLVVNESADIGPLIIVGLDSALHGPLPDKAFAGVPPGKPVLLLIHEGDYLQYVPPRPGNPALALAGHTHGGQIRLPVVGSVGDVFTGKPLCRRGACTIGGWRLFVSSGVGTSVLPIRYGVPPEMVMITLHSPVAPADHSTGRKSGTER